uniref:Uncharacterized protein n=1 Tax=Plectus sambesii TaxID=2011161 RepID=A0A914UUF9_9BILA
MNNMNGGDRSASKEFWKTVSSCLKMTTLIVSLKYDLLKDFEPLSHLTKCLKPIKVERLGFNLSGPPGIIGMVLGTIVENENLRQLKLMCHDAHFNLSHFGRLMNDENISLALSRLDSLKLTTTYCDFDPVYNWEVSLTKIIWALNDHALLKCYVRMSKMSSKSVIKKFFTRFGFCEMNLT